MLSFAASSGTGCRTSQCSTTFPSSTEDVRRGRAAVLGGGLEDAVGHDEIALGDHPLDLQAELGELSPVPPHEPDERLRAVRRLRVVLDVPVAQVTLDGALGIAVVERLLVERSNRLLVLLQIRHDPPPLLPSVNTPGQPCDGQAHSPHHLRFRVVRLGDPKLVTRDSRVAGPGRRP